jgi:probable F420-dependent oxidoreductase
MKFALYGLHRGSSVAPEQLRARAVRAEEAGFEALWVGDHIALPKSAPDSATEPRLEALTALAFLAAATRSVRLGVGVLVLPQRQPVLLAKQLTSLDVLSEGRLDVGVGVGHVVAELEALGVSVSARGAMTDEFLEAILALWTGSPATFEGRWVSFSEVTQSPQPRQRPGPPLIVGGHSRAALRRAARFADGWFGWELNVQETADAIADLNAAAAQSDRRPNRLEITIAPKPPFTLDLALQYAAVGVDRLVLQPRSFASSEIDDLIALAAESLIGRVSGPSPGS